MLLSIRAMQQANSATVTQSEMSLGIERAVCRFFEYRQYLPALQDDMADKAQEEADPQQLMDRIADKDIGHLYDKYSEHKYIDGCSEVF